MILADEHVFDVAGLVAVLQKGVDEDDRRLEAVADGIDDLAAHGDRAAVLDIALLGHADVLQHRLEGLATESCPASREMPGPRNVFRQLVLRHSEIHVAAKLVERRAGRQLGKNTPLDTERLGLLAGQPGMEALRKQRHLAVIGEPELHRRNLDVSHRDHRIAAAETGEQRARDAPDAEGQHQNGHEKLGDPGLGAFAQHV